MTYAEQALFDSLAKVAKRGEGEGVLVAGNRSGYLPLEVKKSMPDARLRIHAFDKYYAHAIKKRFLDAQIDTEGMILCTPQVMAEEEKNENVKSIANAPNFSQMNDQEIAVWYNDNIIYPDKVRLNCYYYRNYSFVKDIQMIFATVLGKKMDYAGEVI
mgnify:CR=1 FL=1